jgi:hypothetical protein
MLSAGQYQRLRVVEDSKATKGNHRLSVTKAKQRTEISRGSKEFTEFAGGLKIEDDSPKSSASKSKSKPSKSPSWKGSRAKLPDGEGKGERWKFWRGGLENGKGCTTVLALDRRRLDRIGPGERKISPEFEDEVPRGVGCPRVSINVGGLASFSDEEADAFELEPERFCKVSGDERLEAEASDNETETLASSSSSISAEKSGIASRGGGGFPASLICGRGVRDILLGGRRLTCFGADDLN